MNLYTESVKPTKKKQRPPSDDESDVSTAASYRLYVTSVLVGSVCYRARVYTCVCVCVCVCMLDGEDN